MVDWGVVCLLAAYTVGPIVRQRGLWAATSLRRDTAFRVSGVWLVKEFGTLLSPFICLLFNQSLATGCFPRNYGHAIVLPLLKKNNLDASQPKNFRPVSNLMLPVEVARNSRAEAASAVS